MWNRTVWAHQCSFQAGSIMIASTHNQHTLFLVQFFCQLLNLIIQTENLLYQIYAKQKHYDSRVFNLTVACLGMVGVSACSVVLIVSLGSLSTAKQCLYTACAAMVHNFIDHSSVWQRLRDP